MNFKKMAITALAGAVMLSSAMPVFASNRNDNRNSQDPKTTITVKNGASVGTNVVTVAKTGGNTISGGSNNSFSLFGHNDNKTSGGTIGTGAAVSGANVSTNVNPTVVDVSCGCLPKKGTLSVSVNSGADVSTNVVTVAKTGGNSTSNGGTIGSGNATAGSVVTGTVNSTVIAL